jgi:hypothetical protein
MPRVMSRTFTVETLFFEYASPDGENICRIADPCARFGGGAVPPCRWRTLRGRNGIAGCLRGSLFQVRCL